MTLKKVLFIIIAIFIVISVVISAKAYMYSDNNTENINVGGLQVQQLSTTEVSITIPNDFIENVKYIIIKNKNGDAESYYLQSNDTNLIVELKEIKLTDADKLTVTMYNNKDDALGDYQEL